MVWMHMLLRRWLLCFQVVPSTFILRIRTQPSKRSFALLSMTSDGPFRFMPATTPIEGFPRIGIVIARVSVADEDRGVKPFLVWLNDGHEMSTGIYAK